MKKMPESLLTSLAAKTTDSAAGQRALTTFRQVTDRVLQKLKQSVVADTVDATKATVIDLVRQLGEKLTKIIQADEAARSDLYIYPDGTRFARRYGPYHVMVIEQKPQIRTLGFDDSIRGHSRGTVRHYAVALPYVVFIIVTYNNGFHGLNLGFRNTPLKSMEDCLGRSNLPNVGNDHSVCMGKVHPLQDASGTPCEIANMTITEYWSSTFNNDISDEFHAWSKKDPTLASVADWERNSLANPLFILEKEWRKGPSVGSMVERYANQKTDPAVQMQQEVLSVVSTIQAKMTQSLDSVEIGTIRPGELTKQFAAALQDILKEVYADVWAYCEGQLTTEKSQLHTGLDDLVREQVRELLTAYKNPW